VVLQGNQSLSALGIQAAGNYVVDANYVHTDNNYTTTEKNKLAGIAAQATKNDTDANLRNRANHTGTQSADTITDGATNKAFTTSEKTKLAGISDEANNYTHPANHPPSIITQNASNRFVTDAEKAAWSGKADKSYVGTAIETAIGNAIAASY